MSTILGLLIFAIVAFLTVTASMGIADNLILPILHGLGISVPSNVSEGMYILVTYFLVIIIYSLYYRYKKYRDEIDADLVKEIKDLEHRLHSAELDVKIYKARYEPETAPQQTVSFDTSQEETSNQTVHAPDISSPHSNSTIHSKKTSKQPFFRSWNPAVFCIVSFFVLIVFFYIRSSFSPNASAGSTSKALPGPISYSVDFETSYVGSANSDFIHRDTCRHAENIQKKNRVYYESVHDALSDGRVKCSECFP